VDERAVPEEKTGEKQPYTPPGIAWSQQVEIRTNLAVACDKAPGGPCDNFTATS
jgi:hypothetical protein